MCYARFDISDAEESSGMSRSGTEAQKRTAQQNKRRRKKETKERERERDERVMVMLGSKINIIVS